MDQIIGVRPVRRGWAHGRYLSVHRQRAASSRSVGGNEERGGGHLVRRAETVEWRHPARLRSRWHRPRGGPVRALRTAHLQLSPHFQRGVTVFNLGHWLSDLFSHRAADYLTEIGVEPAYIGVAAAIIGALASSYKP